MIVSFLQELERQSNVLVICHEVGLDLMWVNPLSANGDKHLISPYSIIAWSNIQVMRIEEMIT